MCRHDIGSGQISSFPPVEMGQRLPCVPNARMVPATIDRTLYGGILCVQLRQAARPPWHVPAVIWSAYKFHRHKTAFSCQAILSRIRRAKLHLEHASTLVKDGGRLVAILPASMREKAFQCGRWAFEWSPIYPGEFAGTSVAVVILVARGKCGDEFRQFSL